MSEEQPNPIYQGCHIGAVIEGDWRRRVYCESPILFRFPRIISNKGSKIEEITKRRQNTWLTRLNRADLTEAKLKHSRVCSLHFIKGKPADDEADPDWAPNLVLGHARVKLNSSAAAERHKRSLKRAVSKELKAGDATDPVATSNVCNEDIIYDSSQCCVAIQTDFTSKDIRDLEDELNLARNRFYAEKEKVSSMTMTTDSFSDKDEKVRFYTGLPNFSILSVVFNFISNEVSMTERNALSSFQEFMIFCMRLRLNLVEQDLAYRFNVCQSTISRIFAKWLDAAFLCMKKTIIWPERENLITTMPLSFKKVFGTSVVVILDCFEVPIDKPTSLITRAATWSQYKHHNTIKFLIGIAPQGVISFISDSFGGRVPDKSITEQCGLLDKLLPGDKVLADRGFNISESVGLSCAELIIPAFTRGKTQLSPFDIHKTRDIASLRIYVERVIGNLRQKYNILRDQIPVELLTTKVGEKVPTIDKIACVCCAFTNLSASVVRLD